MITLQLKKSENPLPSLTGDEFKGAIGAIGSPKALRRYLTQCGQVQAVRKALADGIITEATIERFTDELMADFVPGQQFPHELALCALAVALETRHTDFAGDYLWDLARLDRMSELSFGPKIAVMCLRDRERAPRVTKVAACPTGNRFTTVRPAETCLRYTMLRSLWQPQHPQAQERRRATIRLIMEALAGFEISSPRVRSK